MMLAMFCYIMIETEFKYLLRQQWCVLGSRTGRADSYWQECGGPENCGIA